MEALTIEMFKPDKIKAISVDEKFMEKQMIVL